MERIDDHTTKKRKRTNSGPGIVPARALFLSSHLWSRVVVGFHTLSKGGRTNLRQARR